MIAKIDYYLPQTIVSNEYLASKFPDFSASKIEKKVGIRERRIAAPGETISDMAVTAAEKVLAGYDRNRIDFLLLCTQSSDYLLPGSAGIIQHKLGLATSIGAFDYNLGCSGFVYGLAVAKGLMAGGIAKHILLITAENYSGYLAEDDKSNRTIFGDAAAATILESSEALCSIGNFSLGTDGQGVENLIVRSGGGKDRASGWSSNRPTLYMNGPEIFNFTIEAVPAMAEDVLHRNGLHWEDIDHVVFHQANQYMLKHLQMKLGINDEKFHIDMMDTGNTVSASIPIILAKLIQRNTFKYGDRILIAGFGVGYSYGATILSWKSRGEQK